MSNAGVIIFMWILRCGSSIVLRGFGSALSLTIFDLFGVLFA